MAIVKIENVRVLDPIQQIDRVQTVYLENGKLVAESADISESIDAQGQWLMPTMVDLCARLREPGQQQHGTLKSEGKAARENGILHLFTPPDSKPIVQDNGALIHGLVEKAMLDGGIYLEVIGAQTQGLNGKQPANMAGLKLPAKPYSTPDVVFGDVWKKWRSYYIQHYPKISEHVYQVLEKIAAGHIVVGEEATDD